MDPRDLLKADIGKIAKEGTLIYDQVKSKYETDSKGEFLAIDIDSRNTYLAPTSAEAVTKAREAHPGKVFYVVKIGYDAAETLTSFVHAR